MSLKELRESAGLTQTELATRCDVGQNAVSNWENGISLPQKKYRPRLALALGVSEPEVMRAMERAGDAPC